MRDKTRGKTCRLSTWGGNDVLRSGVPDVVSDKTDSKFNFSENDSSMEFAELVG
jgi:hypothetical protein